LIGLLSVVFLLHLALKMPWIESLYVLVATLVVGSGLVLVLRYARNLSWALHHRPWVLGVMGRFS